MLKKIVSIITIISLMTIAFAGCAKKEEVKNENLKKVTVVLDWVPNTNHTGLYVAKDKGYFKEEGLDVEIIQPSEGGSISLVAAGQAEFGISYQEEVTYARTLENSMPIKAVAAIIQHNTSGFASPVSKNIKSPKDFEGKKYGGWGMDVERAMLKGLMEKEGADFSKLEMVDIGVADFFTSVKNNVDFTWIYYGWDGVASEVKDFPINFIKLTDIDPNLDYYTPLIVAKEDLLNNDKELVSKFLKAVTKGYEYCIDNPEDAVKSLLKEAPEIDEKIAVESQKYLANEYKADAKRWGEMKEEIWTNYSNWMYEKGLIENKINVKEAFTNEYLPQ
ncbi:ABC transporter substrate-binding protein [Tepidibacter formicigenes]|jgi:ABC-type nitrate/sulfonate/bicarbonate transport system substrate-binding protein|uniref:ABC-type nitrate/sulfonate/bicarbonate transport system, substrate-binding protein n=1 Tax=Tepidibacter formicigenes DSM 15518 TaxID=1123349 RepID=A0A1M6NA20_9FIRM|nr:ABC transporter substrate-binding protein [Tepidibacter formicigenes]SHJ92532.1 ABC-type nitrate/sulfonate/bicarbonate transport system, substrate-binding protein [Tepidibacter formicigenes DSM 15518]